MMIIDNALQKRLEAKNPIKIGMIGAGYSGQMVAYQIIKNFPAIKLVAIANRTLATAKQAFEHADIFSATEVNFADQVNDASKENKYVITDNYRAVCEADELDAIIETTGTVNYASEVSLNAIKNGKHVIALNCEVDATVGPILSHYARKAGVVFTNTDGDEPGVATNLFRFVKIIGLKPIVVGNLKGYYDPYRNPTTQLDFALKHNQKPTWMTAFIDGAKLSMELTVLANCLGFTIGKRGMYGPCCADVREAIEHFPLEKYHSEGIVDYLLGADPKSGVFVIGLSEDNKTNEYLEYFKMGKGPYYIFYRPFHLPHQELPITIARAVLFHDPAVSAKDRPYCDTIAIAKTDLKEGEKLDGIGGYTCYGLIEKSELVIKEKILPLGISDGCILTKDLVKDTPITYNDVLLPENRVCDKLRNEQTNIFFNNL